MMVHMLLFKRFKHELLEIAIVLDYYYMPFKFSLLKCHLSLITRNEIMVMENHLTLQRISKKIILGKEINKELSISWPGNFKSCVEN